MDLEFNKWYENDSTEYMYVSKNGRWLAVRFKGDMAIYSFCPYCGFTHPCYKEKFDSETKEWSFGCFYAPEKEYRFCPQCGKYMSIRKHKNIPDEV